MGLFSKLFKKPTRESLHEKEVPKSPRPSTPPPPPPPIPPRQNPYTDGWYRCNLCGLTGSRARLRYHTCIGHFDEPIQYHDDDFSSTGAFFTVLALEEASKSGETESVEGGGGEFGGGGASGSWSGSGSEDSSSDSSGSSSDSGGSGGGSDSSSSD